MIEAITRELEQLLAASQAMLDCAVPSVEMWEEYSRTRTRVFQRWQGDPAAVVPASDDAGELHRLITLVQQQDMILLGKVRRQLSEVCRQLAGVKESKRMVDAYDHNALSSGVLPRSAI
jgi:hypothetical protein